MKTKIKLTKEQVDELVKEEEKILKARFEKDLEAIRKKYEILEIEISGNNNKIVKKKKLTDEILKQYQKENLSAKQISEITNLNVGYIYKRLKQISNQVVEITKN